MKNKYNLLGGFGLLSLFVLSGCALEIPSTHTKEEPTRIEISKEEKESYQEFMGDSLSQISTLAVTLVEKSATFIKDPKNLESFSKSIDKTLGESNQIINQTLEKQKNMKVSKELQPAHDKMNESLSDMKTGVNDVKDGTSTGDPFQVIKGINQIEKSQADIIDLKKQLGI